MSINSLVFSLCFSALLVSVLQLATTYSAVSGYFLKRPNADYKDVIFLTLKLSFGYMPMRAINISQLNTYLNPVWITRVLHATVNSGSLGKDTIAVCAVLHLTKHELFILLPFSDKQISKRKRRNLSLRRTTLRPTQLPLLQPSPPILPGTLDWLLSLKAPHHPQLSLRRSQSPSLQRPRRPLTVWAR